MKQHILIIDDEELLRNFLRTFLEKEGYRVSEAKDGFEGLEIIKTRSVDAIITDILMPRLSGLDLIREVRKIFSEILIIATSGTPDNGEINYLQSAKKLGASLTFEKPYDVDEILKQISRFFSAN